MLIEPEVASGMREINRHNAYYFSARVLEDKRVCIYSSDNSPVVFGVRRLNLFCSLRQEASAFDSVVVFGGGTEKIVREKNERWYKSAAARDTPISIWLVHSTQMHNLGGCECKYVQAGWHECTSAIHHPQVATPSHRPLVSSLHLPPNSSSHSSGRLAEKTNLLVYFYLSSL